MTNPFDSDEPIPGITDLIKMQELRYSSQHDPALWLCRDCGAIVKDGWLSMHDGLHSAIGYPVYPYECPNCGTTTPAHYCMGPPAVDTYVVAPESGFDWPPNG